MSRHRSSRSSHTGERTREHDGVRTVDKSRTRRALLDGALDLLRDRSLDNLGIREVTRAAGVAPAAFYRHFQRIDDLGLVLVEEAFATLRGLMREAREDAQDPDRIITSSVRVLVDHVRAHQDHYRFIAREQMSPIVSVKLAIRRELRLFATELATDLARLPGVDRWPTPDLVMLAEMIVALMVDTSRRLLDVFEEAPEREAEVVADVERRLRFLALGTTAWTPRTTAR